MKEHEFGKILQNERKKQGLSQAQLAEMTGFTVRAISYWENGGRELSISAAKKLLDAMEIELIITTRKKEETKWHKST